MTLDDFYGLSKDECFQILKGECRTQAKRRLCGSLICMLLIIAIIIGILIWKPQEFEYYSHVFYICLLSVFCLASGWYAVNNYRLLHRLDSLDTPEQLLHLYEKTVNNHRKVVGLVGLGCLGALYPEIGYNIKYLDRNWVLVDLVTKVAIITFWVYVFFKGYFEHRSRRDEEIIDRLQDLIDMK